MSKILMLTEGKDPDKKLIEHVVEKFQIKGEVIWAKIGTIYAFYKDIKEKYDENMDIIRYIKYKYSDKISKEFKASEISYVYLFFDYDLHSKLNEEYKNIEKIYERINEISEINSFFENETENGKLYLSFPMIEAYHKPIGCNYIYEKNNFEEKLEDFTDFKKKIKNQTGNMGMKAIKSQYKKVINFYIDNSENILEMKFKDVEKNKILKFQNELLKEENKVKIYPSIPIFLNEYYEIEKLQEKLKI